MNTKHSRSVRTTAVVGLGLMLCAGAANADGRDGWGGRRGHGHGHHERHHHHGHHNHYGYHYRAPIAVYPSFGYSAYVPAPTVVYQQRYSYAPPVQYAQPYYGGAYATGPNFGSAAGAALGGYIGSQMGHGDERLATTAAGAVLGFMVGGQAGGGYRY